MKQKKWELVEMDGYCLIKNEGGPVLGFSKESGVSILELDGFAFKDLNKNGVLDPYEDWRLPVEERIADLVKKMTLEEIAGLMLYSGHQSITSSKSPFGNTDTYNGKSFEEAGVLITQLTDQQKKFLREDHLRHVLVTIVDDAYTAAKWNNNVQAYTEGSRLGIPANNSSDPRHGANANAEFNIASGGDISRWPESVGLAATFDPNIVKRFGEIASTEYRYLGLATALSPQIDLATDPRWMRFDGTFGEGTKLTTAMAKAYCDGFQTSTGEKEIANGWGYDSVNTMVKHWPGGGSGEGGRDAHYAYGKYAVYPGNNFDEHLLPFTKGAFALDGKTECASAVMPYYTISYGQDIKDGENVGNAYSKYIITDLLREKYHYDGVVCTDWSITHDNDKMDVFISGKCWGVEKTSEEERHYKALMAGVDQYGGNNRKEPIIKAYEMGVMEHGEKFMRLRMEQSATRLVRNIMRTGLFENAYIDPKEASEVVGNPDFMKEGYEAQLKSIVLLKNKKKLLPLKRETKVYIPDRLINESIDWFGNVEKEKIVKMMLPKQVENYFTVVDSPNEAEVAIVCIESPKCKPYSNTEGYLPISLQYRPYTARLARKISIAGGDPLESSTNRSYYGKTNTTDNETDLDLVLETKRKMGDKPVIVILGMRNPTIVAEFEKAADAIVLSFGVQNQALLDVISGVYEPSGLLPFQMPKDMATVELQREDVGLDMEPYTDECGNSYDFGYGLNFSGTIQDYRQQEFC